MPATVEALPHYTSLGRPLDLSPEAFGFLRSSADVAGDDGALRARLEDDGYLYLPGYFDREQVLDVRSGIAQRLERAGLLEPGTDAMGCIARKEAGVSFMPELARDNPPLMRLLYTGRMIELYERLLLGEVRHYDFTWFRAISPGKGTPPHCDIVYMGRGTDRLYTAWTPIGDVGLDVGGLIILEGSHKHVRLRENYGRKDVDRWCTNRRPGPPTGLGEGGNIGRGGWLSKFPDVLQKRLGGRWLTADFRAGDLLTFSMYTVHAAIDNISNQIRLSSDSRYQLASDPVDERWVGENPVAHGPEAKIGMVC